MRKNQQQQQHYNGIKYKQQYHDDDNEDITVMRLNQNLPPQANFLLFLLIALALINNTTRSNDYNVVMGCGLYFLSSKHPLLHKMVYFYLLVTLTICADVMVMVLLYGKVDMFHSLIVPGIQILLKILLLIVQGLYWRKENEDEKIRMQRKSKQNAHIIKQLQQQKAVQISKLTYQQQKNQQKPNPSSYYMPKYNHNLSINNKQAYQHQQYKQFNRQQFINNPVQNEQQLKERRY